MVGQKREIGAPGGDERLRDYGALRDRVDAFAAAVGQARAADMACRAGCAGCCQGGLSVSAVEAAAIARHIAGLPGLDRQALSLRAQTLQTQTMNSTSPNHGQAATDPAEESDATDRCVMLRRDDTCAIYAARPLVCRTQGLPLSYAADLVPLQAVRWRGQDGRAIVCCPLNFAGDGDGDERGRVPTRAEILDAERVDLLLATLNQRYAAAVGQAPTLRTSLLRLAGAAAVEDDGADHV